MDVNIKSGDSKSFITTLSNYDWFGYFIPAVMVVTCIYVIDVLAGINGFRGAITKLWPGSKTASSLNLNDFILHNEALYNNILIAFTASACFFSVIYVLGHTISMFSSIFLDKFITGRCIGFPFYYILSGSYATSKIFPRMFDKARKLRTSFVIICIVNINLFIVFAFKANMFMNKSHVFTAITDIFVFCYFFLVVAGFNRLLRRNYHASLRYIFYAACLCFYYLFIIHNFDYGPRFLPVKVQEIIGINYSLIYFSSSFSMICLLLDLLYYHKICFRILLGMRRARRKKMRHCNLRWYENYLVRRDIRIRYLIRLNKRKITSSKSLMLSYIHKLIDMQIHKSLKRILKRYPDNSFSMRIIRYVSGHFLFPTFYGFLSLSRINRSFPSDIAKSIVNEIESLCSSVYAKTDKYSIYKLESETYWLVFAYLKNIKDCEPLAMLSNWVNLYGFARNLSAAFIFVAAYFIFMHFAFGFYDGGIIRCVFLACFLMSLFFYMRYLYLFSNYYSKFLYRCFMIRYIEDKDKISKDMAQKNIELLKADVRCLSCGKYFNNLKNNAFFD